MARSFRVQFKDGDVDTNVVVFFFQSTSFNPLGTWLQQPMAIKPRKRRQHTITW